MTTSKEINQIVFQGFNFYKIGYNSIIQWALIITWNLNFNVYWNKNLINIKLNNFKSLIFKKN